MCGIVGFSSHTQGACRPLVNGLRLLEYRGVRSARPAFCYNTGMETKGSNVR